MTEPPPEPKAADAQTRAQERADAAAYIADLSASLAEIAKRHRLEALGYLLDMVHTEAESQARAKDGGG